LNSGPLPARFAVTVERISTSEASRPWHQKSENVHGLKWLTRQNQRTAIRVSFSAQTSQWSMYSVLSGVEARNSMHMLPCSTTKATLWLEVVGHEET
jgi:hypothetical protein